MVVLRRQVEALSLRVVGQTRRGTNTELTGLAPFSPAIRVAIMPAELKLTAFTKFTGKTNLEEHIAEFQSQMSFHQTDSTVYCKSFSASLAGPALKAYTYIRIEEAEKWVEKGKGNHSLDEHQQLSQSPEDERLRQGPGA
ncbi:hypothetical protein LIER_40296 [Lithospermum erythrorhizon]|uniref:Uncharacterized protein n=1 Tax=Lithospermum erythrorhizon TaxID=34254 RepID=A0AAV3QTK8_LITER